MDWCGVTGNNCHCEGILPWFTSSIRYKHLKSEIVYFKRLLCGYIFYIFVLIYTDRGEPVAKTANQSSRVVCVFMYIYLWYCALFYLLNEASYCVYIKSLQLWMEYLNDKSRVSFNVYYILQIKPNGEYGLFSLLSSVTKQDELRGWNHYLIFYYL